MPFFIFLAYVATDISLLIWEGDCQKKHHNQPTGQLQRWPIFYLTVIERLYSFMDASEKIKRQPVG